MPQCSMLLASNRSSLGGGERPRHIAKRNLAGCFMAALFASVAVLSSTPTYAGATLLTRHSSLHASRGGGLDQQRSFDGFDTFASEVGDPDGPSGGLMSMAHQFSSPGILGTSGAGLEGTFGEGQVRSQTTNTGGQAQAHSIMDMTFSID